MPKKSESLDQPKAAANEARRSKPDAQEGSKRTHRSAAKEEAAPGSIPAPAGQPAAGNANAEAAPIPAQSEQIAPAPAALAGLRGEGYVKALKSHPLTTLHVPLLPNERRGDWQRAKGVKIPVITRQFDHALERDHTLAALVIELQRPGATRFDQIDLQSSSVKEAIERLSDYTNQAQLRAQVQTGKKWTASQVYLIPIEDARKDEM
jgi:hypothetical protein